MFATFLPKCLVLKCVFSVKFCNIVLATDQPTNQSTNQPTNTIKTNDQDNANVHTYAKYLVLIEDGVARRKGDGREKERGICGVRPRHET
jgi:hypothetical protein